MTATARRHIAPLASLFGIAFLTACSAVPAKLTQVHSLSSRPCDICDHSLHGLLTLSLESPNEGESAHALGHFVERWREERGDAMQGDVPSPEPEAEASYRITFRAGHEGAYRPAYFDTLRPAVDYRVRRVEHHTREGIGAPLLALRENRQIEPLERHYPPEAITRAVTAVIHPGSERQAGLRHVAISLHCSLRDESVVVRGEREPLAADYSVPWAALLERTGDLGRSARAEFFRNDPVRDPALYLTEAYDPDKEPLIMIHGLLSTPLVWAQVSNDLRARDEIRRRYQIWHYLYHTSAPALYSGRLLRRELEALRPQLDPDLDDPGLRRITLLTHSMGGLVARSLVTDPGDAFWDLAFTRPIEELALSPEDEEALRDAFFWKPVPEVRRVIFVCVPHRGSDYADNPLGRIGRRLAEPPDAFRAFYERISSANPGAFTEAYAELGRGELDSVGALSPRQPTLQILADLPVGNQVALHSILGDRGRPGPREKSSDGVVAYWSSHLPEADSEVIVPSGHNAMKNGEAVAEIERVLLLP